MYQELLNFYRGLIRMHGGDSVHTVSYQSRSTQYVRFNVLLQNTIPNKTNKLTLLDLGCGTGDMYDYLRQNNFTNVVYTGIDIVPEMIAAAQKNYPQGNFLVKNFVEEELGQYDIICASGSLNIIFDKRTNHLEYIKTVIKKMYDNSRLACAFNLLNQDSEWMYEQDLRFYYADKNEILKYCRTFCADAKLSDDYLINDFSLALKH